MIFIVRVGWKIVAGVDGNTHTSIRSLQNDYHSRIYTGLHWHTRPATREPAHTLYVRMYHLFAIRAPVYVTVATASAECSRSRTRE